MKNKLVIYLRWSLLALFVALITTASYLHITNGGAKSPSIHALCPYGGLESLYQLFTTGSFVSKIFAGTLVLFLITIILAIIFRRSFCGLICPFGAIQEFFAKLGQKLFKRKFIVSSKVDRPLRYLKYVILIITIFYAWRTAGLWMSPYDPWSAYAHLPEGLSSVWAESAIGLVILVVTIAGSMLYDRFFCKYLCPMGAIYGFIGKISPFKIKRNENVCISCGKCNKVCPMNINVQNVKEVKSAECINCQTCVLNCPKAGVLENSLAGKPLKPIIVIGLIMVLFFGSILIFQATGVYKLLPDKPKAGETIKLDEVKGYMTIKDAAESTGTELEEFYKKYEIPGNVPSDTMMKDISKSVDGYELDKVKEKLAGQDNEANQGENSAATLAEEDGSKPEVDLSAVKGSMTIKDAAKAANIGLKEFYKLFRIPDNIPSNTYMKDIGKNVPGYDFRQIKEGNQ
ncbi:MAG TPA: 4Fe-4S binding protein [Clostridia bacterium]|nr:4Fe-4S binding protein [Clostridia bacterium]